MQQQQLLYVLAHFDAETETRINALQRKIKEAGFIGQQAYTVSHHITVASFDPSLERAVLPRFMRLCNAQRAFPVALEKVGLFGESVLFLTPGQSPAFLALRNEFPADMLAEDHEYVPHATLLIDTPPNVLGALPIASKNFAPIHGRIEALSLYAYKPSRFIASYRLH